MGLTMEMRKGFAREKAKRCRQGSMKKIGQLIEESMEMPGCSHHHARMDTALLGYPGAGAARWSTVQDRGSLAPLTAAHGADLRPADGRRADQVVAPLRLPVRTTG